MEILWIEGENLVCIDHDKKRVVFDVSMDMARNGAWHDVSQLLCQYKHTNDIVLYIRSPVEMDLSDGVVAHEVVFDVGENGGEMFMRADILKRVHKIDIRRYSASVNNLLRLVPRWECLGSIYYRGGALDALRWIISPRHNAYKIEINLDDSHLDKPYDMAAYIPPRMYCAVSYLTIRTDDAFLVFNILRSCSTEIKIFEWFANVPITNPIIELLTRRCNHLELVILNPNVNTRQYRTLKQLAPHLVKYYLEDE